VLLSAPARSRGRKTFLTALPLGNPHQDNGLDDNKAELYVLIWVNFYLYARTSAQLAEFHSRLDVTQRFLLANSLCETLDQDSKIHSAIRNSQFGFGNIEARATLPVKQLKVTKLVLR
jgi:hypothetical protein